MSEASVFPKHLAAKLDAARSDVQGVGKNGKATEGYEFVQAIDVAVEAGRALKEHGILTVPSVRSLNVKYGKEATLVHATLSFEVVDVETGESVILDWAGSGLDNPGDKALYMAITGGTKYFRAWLLEIPFGIDPEAPSEADLLRQQQDVETERPDLAAVSSV
jgi:hypothetical protein